MLLNFFLVAAWVATSSAVSNVGCPRVALNTRQYLATFRNMCYVFINVEKFWDEARDYCLWLGGELVHIHDMETMDFLKSVLDSKELGWSNNGVWIGASDNAKEGHWVWTTGEEVSWSYWAKGQPRTWPLAISMEDCAQMRRSDGWRWHDYSCSLALYHYNSICQFPLEGSSYGKAAQQSLPNEETVMSEGNVLGIVIGLSALVVIIMALIMFYYKRWLKKKYVAKEPAVLFQNTSYAQIHNDADGSTTRTTVAANNSYWNTNKVNMLYEKVNKQVNHGMNAVGNHNLACSNNLDKTCGVEEGAAAWEKLDKVNLKGGPPMKVKMINTEVHPKLQEEEGVAAAKENVNINLECDINASNEKIYEEDDTLYAKK